MKTFLEVFGQRWGVDVNTIHIQGERYMTRYILYVSGFSLRLHKFYRGDDLRAPHSHPWAFLTFPVTGYWEQVEYYDPEISAGCWTRDIRFVRSWRIHYRPANYRHIVYGRSNVGPTASTKPFWTLVLAGREKQKWGFYPYPEFFVPEEKWHDE